MNHYQNTTEWHDDRCGNITASRLSDTTLVKPEQFRVIRATGTTLKVCSTEQEALEALEEANAKKAGHTLEYTPMSPLKGFEDYMAELVCERLTGVQAVIPDSYATKWGHDNEPYAIRAFENRTGLVIEPCGFIKAPASTGLANYGASPDGLIDADGSAEVKCPVNSTRHLRCFVEGIPAEHWPQLEGQLLATGRKYVQFISFDPRFIGDYAHLGLFTARYESKPDLKEELLAGIIRMEAAVAQFIAKLPKAGGDV
jgi:hypothetical protein